MVAVVDDDIVEKENQSKPAGTSVFHHSLVTENSDALKFNAAASLQLQSWNDHTALAQTDTRLIISPYNDDRALLDLTTLDTQSRLLAKALTTLKPIRDDYATAEYGASFNWESVLGVLRELAAAEDHVWEETSFYVVTFRSRLLPTADPDVLYDLDFHSLAEATASGGLLKYWFGTKDEEHQNLATCVWRNREDARRGGTGPWHKKARGAASWLYDSIVFKTLSWTIGDGAKKWEMVSWDG